jgi:hypothetical protein
MEVFGLRLSVHGSDPSRNLPLMQAQMPICERHMLYPGMRANRLRPQVVGKIARADTYDPIVNRYQGRIITKNHRRSASPGFTTSSSLRKPAQARIGPLAPKVIRVQPSEAWSCTSRRPAVIRSPWPIQVFVRPPADPFRTANERAETSSLRPWQTKFVPAREPPAEIFYGDQEWRGHSCRSGWKRTPPTAIIHAANPVNKSRQTRMMHPK